MASLVSGSHGPTINKTFSHLKEKMVELATEIKKTEEQTKEFKMASREHFARERIAVDKQYAIRDRMQEIDTRIDKTETKIEWFKERLFVAVRRNEENLKTCQSLENNRVDVPSFDERMQNSKDRFTIIAENTANKNKKIEALKVKVDAAEKRTMKAKIRVGHLEEIQRSREQMKRTESLNYTPKTDEEYIEEINELKYRLSEAVRKFQEKEAKQASFERQETEIEANIQHLKKKTLSVKQARHEMSGSKMY